MMSGMATSGWSGLTAAEVRALAPDAIASFDLVLAAAADAAEHDPLTELARRRVVARLTPGAADDVDDASLTVTEQACVTFAEQFVLDVSLISDTERTRLADALGRHLFGFVQALYVFDHGLRVRTAIRQLFGCDVFTAASSGDAAQLWPALERMMTAVVVLDALDPLTGELVRLRGARAHQCRVCMSRRLAPVVATHGAVVLEHTEIAGLTDLGDATTAALRLTDAVLWQPTAVPHEVLADVRASLTPAAALEVVLDVARNASNKIAVALGADAASVAEGVEYFDVSATGDYTYGLPSPRGR
jgi:alkylhydroperoxidase family enzyme